MAEQVEILEIKVKSQSLDAALEQARDQVRRLNAEFRKTKEGTDDYRRLSGEIATAKNRAKELSDQQKAINREFAAMKVPKDSLAGLRLEYSKLSQQIAQLSAEERKSQFGKSLISSAKGVKGQIDGIEQSIGRFTGNVGNYQSAFRGLMGALSGAGIALGVGEIIQATRESEKLFAVLKNTLGSESEAQKIFAGIQQFAKETPFQIGEIGNAFNKLEQRNFNPTIENLRVIGDIAAASGKDINQFVEAILDAQTFEFERLKEFGIVVRKNGDDLKVTFRGQTETIKKTDDAIKDYLLRIGQLPGIQGSALAVSKTLDGSISNLADNFTQLFATIGGGGGILKGIVDAFSSLVGSVNDFISVPVSQQLRDQQSEFSALIGVLQDANTEESVRTEIIATLKREYPEYLKFVTSEGKQQIDLAASLLEGNKLFEQRILLQATAEEREKIVKRRIEAERELTRALVEQQKIEQSGQGGQRVGLVRTDFQASGDDRRLTQTTLAEERVNSVRRTIELTTAELKKLDEEVNATSLRKYGKTLADLQTANAVGAGKPGGASGAKTAKEEAKAAKDSIKALQDEVSRLNTELENAPPNQVERILGDLVAAEKRLEAVKKRVEFLRKPVNARFVPGASSDNAPPLSVADSELSGDGVSGDAQRMLDAISNQLTLEVRTMLLPPSDEQVKALTDSLEEVRRKNRIAEWDEAKQNEAQDKERRKQQIYEGIQAGADLAQGVNSQLSDLRRQEIDDALNAELEALDKKTQKQIEAAGNNQAAIDQINKDAAKKRDEIEKQAAEKRKQIAIKEALIGGALAVIKALPNPIAAAAAAAATLIQVAIMRKQKFERGGKVQMISGPRHAAGGVQGYFSDGTQIEVEGGEEVHILKRNDYAKKRALSLENVRRGGVSFFDRGGTIPLQNIPIRNTYGPSSGSAATVSISPDDMRQMAALIAAETAGQTSDAVEGAVSRGIETGTRSNERIKEAKASRTI